MTREARWAGRFYPGKSDDLTKMIRSFWKKAAKQVEVKAIIVPHAGYVYSGAVAAEVYSSVKLPKRFIIISPNHWEGITKAGVDTEDQWETPLGAVKIDKEISMKILSKTDLIQESGSVHEKEHAIEVQLPFLQYAIGNDFSFCPISMLNFGLKQLHEIGKTLAESIKETGQPVLLVSSTDMSHYVEHREAKQLDMMAIDCILKMDAEALYNTVIREGISMCGLSPTVSVLIAAQELGAKKAELIRYATSGETSGDYDQVVGYAGVVIN